MRPGLVGILSHELEVMWKSFVVMADERTADKKPRSRRLAFPDSFAQFERLLERTADVTDRRNAVLQENPGAGLHYFCHSVLVSREVLRVNSVPRNHQMS